MNRRIQESVRVVLTMLAESRFADVEKLTKGTRLNASAMALAINDYGKTLVMPPESGFRLMNVIEVKNAQPRRWSIIMPLWTREEGRSDLTMELTVIETINGISVELDNIHVL